MNCIINFAPVFLTWHLPFLTFTCCIEMSFTKISFKTYSITIKVRPLLQQMHYCTCKRHRRLRKDGHKNKWAADHRERQRCTSDRPPSIHYKHTWVPRTQIQILYITPSQLSIISILGYLGQKIQLQIPYIKPSIHYKYTWVPRTKNTNTNTLYDTFHISIINIPGYPGIFIMDRWFYIRYL